MKQIASNFYRYYVYVAPGVVEYFRESEFEEANDYAAAHRSKVIELNKNTDISIY
jgi:hypothetical protein